MREALLHFIWRHRHFNQQELFTGSGEALQVLSPGDYHADQGPDFRNGRIRIGDRIRQGPVELHVLATDWIRHAHDGDVHYKDTILHVVWINDWPSDLPTPGNIPILELQERVPKLLLSRYERWMKNPVFVPCERQLPEAEEAVKARWLAELVLQRLQRRAQLIGRELETNRQHWEATTWIWIARTMGMPVNTAVFEAIARSLPVELLARYREQRLSLEALLFGQAHLLHGHPELEREYQYLQIKHELTPVSLPASFLRMRPANFPTIRLAQLAGLLMTGQGWFARIREARSPGDIWEEVTRLGRMTKDKMVINAFVPLLYTYGWQRKEPVLVEKAVRWLHETAPEKNTILHHWQQLGITAIDAADSQALLELKKQYCDARRCLDCAIGNRWLISLVNTG